jgi:WD40 repeat protein
MSVGTCLIRLQARLREATGDYARSVTFSPDGRWLAVAMLTQEVEIWDVETRRLVKRLRGHTWDVNAVAYSPDGSQLASGCQDGTIRFWDPHPPTIQRLMPEVRFAKCGRPAEPPFIMLRGARGASKSCGSS